MTRKAPPPPYSTKPPAGGRTPAPSAPVDDGTGSDTKGIDWSINRRGVHPSAPSKASDWSLEPHNTPPAYHPHNPRPTYPGSGHTPGPSHMPATVNTANPPVSAYAAWKEKFSRVYPDSKMYRDDPSIIRVEIPKNRAFPVSGHATCPDCFDNGPHFTAEVKKKVNFIFSKNIPAQKCRRCCKLTYFVQTNEEVKDVSLPSDKPPPYHNRPSPFLSQGLAPTSSQIITGHGWCDEENEIGHGWKPNDETGHGWST